MKEELGLMFAPTLIDLLDIKEKEKGSPLTKDEVISIRDIAYRI